MATKSPKTYTYESIVLNALHGEFSFSKKEEAEAEIKRKLKRYKAGAYDQQRVDLMRRFKNELQWEIGLRPLPELSIHRELGSREPHYKPRESRYYVGRHGRYGDYTDFDMPKMTTDMIAHYPQIPAKEIEWFVRFAVGTYYLL